MLSLNTLVTDLRKSFSGMPSPTDAAASSSTAQKSTPRIRMQRVLPEYACMIKCTDLGVDIVAALPPSFTWNTSAHYDTPFKDAISQTINGSVVGQIAGGIASAGGLSMVTQTLTAKFWSGSESGAITLPLVFQAMTNEVDEVLKPIAQLMSLTVPRTLGGKNGSLLQAPGPHFDLTKAATSAYNTASNTISVAGQQTMAENASSWLGTLDTLRGKIQTLVGSSPGDAANTVMNGIVNGVSATASALDNFARNNIVNNISLQLGRFMLFDHVVITDVNYEFPVQPVGREYGYSTGNFPRVEVSVTFEPFFDIVQRDLASIFLDPNLRQYFEQLINKNSKAKF